MTDKLPYTYSVLRYVHDVAAGERVNVGVVLYCPKAHYFGARLRHTHGRFSDLFPDLDPAAFKASMSALERGFRTVSEACKRDDLFRPKADAVSLACSVLPADDSSLQWSSLGSGLTADPERQLEHLYQRLVSRYDEKHQHRRTDAEVWRPVRERLDRANLSSKLMHKVIRGTVDELEFEHAWKNGAWHCYEALSFDLATVDGIKAKARNWIGHLAAVRDSPEKFKPYFIVGAPSDRKLLGAYQDGLAILRQSPIESEVYPEADVDQLVRRIEDEIRAHDRTV